MVLLLLERIDAGCRALPCCIKLNLADAGAGIVEATGATGNATCNRIVVHKTLPAGLIVKRFKMFCRFSSNDAAECEGECREGDYNFCLFHKREFVSSGRLL